MDLEAVGGQAFAEQIGNPAEQTRRPDPGTGGS
jgi:hypothetical protein